MTKLLVGTKWAKVAASQLSINSWKDIKKHSWIFLTLHISEKNRLILRQNITHPEDTYFQLLNVRKIQNSTEWYLVNVYMLLCNVFMLSLYIPKKMVRFKINRHSKNLFVVVVNYHSLHQIWSHYQLVNVQR